MQQKWTMQQKCILYSYWYFSHSMRSRVYKCWTSVCLSVRPTIRPPYAAAAGLLLSAVAAGNIDRQRRPPNAQQQQRRSTAHSSKCEQCRVDSWRRKLNARLLWSAVDWRNKAAWLADDSLHPHLRYCSSAASAVRRPPSAVRTATPAFDVRSSGLFCGRPCGLELVTRLPARSVTFLCQFSPEPENFSFLVY